MANETRECPGCSSMRIWRYGSRTIGNGSTKRYLCRNCGHVWEESLDSPIIRSVNDKAIMHIRRLMEKAVGDAERGFPVKDRGWIKCDKEMADALLRTDLCEIDKKREEIRILPSVEFPDDLAALDATKMLLDVRRAETIAQELIRIWKTDGRYNAIMQGLRSMLDSGIRIISPKRFEMEEKMCSWEWFTLAHNAVNSLVLMASEAMWKDDIEEIDMARKSLGDKAPGTEDVERILRWRDVTNGLGRDTLEALGFLWFTDGRLQEIESSVGKRIAQNAILKVIGLDKSINRMEEVLGKTEANYVNFPWF